MDLHFGVSWPEIPDGSVGASSQATPLKVLESNPNMVAVLAAVLVTSQKLLPTSWAGEAVEELGGGHGQPT